MPRDESKVPRGGNDPGRTVEHGVEVPRVDEKRNREGEDFQAAERQRAQGREKGEGLEVGPVTSHVPSGQGASGGVAGGAEATNAAGTNRDADPGEGGNTGGAGI